MLREASLEETQLRQSGLDDCDLTRATLHRTPLKGIDLRSSRWAALTVDIPDLRGAVVTEQQAAQLAGLLGLVIRD